MYGAPLQGALRGLLLRGQRVHQAPRGTQEQGRQSRSDDPLHGHNVPQDAARRALRDPRAEHEGGVLPQRVSLCAEERIGEAHILSIKRPAFTKTEKERREHV